MGLLGNTHFENLNDLFVQQIEDLYDAETRLMDALPKMRDAAHSPELKDAFTQHLEETRRHAQRLNDIFRSLGRDPKRETCAAMKGLIKEGQDMISATGDPTVKDAALIAAGQRVEHYEMAGYGTVRMLASRLGLGEIVNTLQLTLNEEVAADKTLTRIAETYVNVRAPVSDVTPQTSTF
jgi:ferritin-like metal-binding protein YciE